MDSCVDCKEPAACTCLMVFIDGYISPDPRSWVEFQTIALINELQEIARNIRASSNQSLEEPPDWVSDT